MARTTSDAVEAIIDVQTGEDLTPFITIANELVTELLAGEHDATRLELIERWLSAHFYTVKDPRAEYEKAGEVAQRLQSKVDIGLRTSHYGQTAIILDTSGLLSSYSDGKVKVIGGATWLGTENS